MLFKTAGGPAACLQPLRKSGTHLLASPPCHILPPAPSQRSACRALAQRKRARRGPCACNKGRGRQLGTRIIQCPYRPPR
eukprot:10383292-Alexandrium_andersonii.AAC.1